MFNTPRQNAPDSRLCRRCGTQLNRSMRFCPECGANQQAAASRETAAREADTPRSGAPYYAFATVTVFAVLFTAYGISYHHERKQPPDVSAAQGAVSEQPPLIAAPAPGESGTTAQPVLASMLPHRPLQGPLDTAHGDGTEHYGASQSSLSDESADVRSSSMSLHSDAARSLARARASLDRNSLWPARRDIMTALAEQPRNGEAQQMRSELASREHERESLLASARLCVREGHWTCVRNNAAHALTVDASSRTARELLSRAIARQGSGSSERSDPVVSGANIDQ
jgi:hypothetical protein